MKRTGILPHLLGVMGLIVLLAGCGAPSAASPGGSPTPLPHEAQASPPSSSSITQLKPDGPVPSSCPITPVYRGGEPFASNQTIDNSPWLAAEPASSEIVAHLVYSDTGEIGGNTYRLPPVDGVFKEEGLHTKTMWTIANPDASSELLIAGTLLSDSGNTFHDNGNAISFAGQLPNLNYYTSYISAPSKGCWRLEITSGQVKGSIVIWVKE